MSSSQSSSLVVNGVICTDNAEYKDNLMERIGGESQFNFLLISYCERLIAEKRLKGFLESLDIKGLQSLQREVLLTAFLKVSATDEEVLRGRLVLKHYLLFQRGFNETHYDTMLRVLEAAMRDCWVEADVLNVCKKYLQELRPIFEENASLKLQATLQEDVYVDRLCSSLAERLESQSLSSLKTSVLGKVAKVAQSSSKNSSTGRSLASKVASTVGRRQ